MAHIKNIMEKYCQNIVPQILRYDGLFQLREFLATRKDSWPLSASDQIGPFSCVGETQFWNCGKWSKAVNERKVKVTFKSWVLGYSSLSHDRWLSSEKFTYLKFELSLGLYMVFSSVHVKLSMVCASRNGSLYMKSVNVIPIPFSHSSSLAIVTVVKFWFNDRLSFASFTKAEMI